MSLSARAETEAAHLNTNVWTSIQKKRHNNVKMMTFFRFVCHNYDLSTHICSYVVEMRFYTIKLLLNVRKVKLLIVYVCICVIIHLLL